MWGHVSTVVGVMGVLHMSVTQSKISKYTGNQTANYCLNQSRWPYKEIYLTQNMNHFTQLLSLTQLFKNPLYKRIVKLNFF